MTDQLTVHSPITDLPRPMQQSIVLDLVKEGYTGEKLKRTLQQSSLQDIAWLVNLPAYRTLLDDVENVSYARGRFYVSEKDGFSLDNPAHWSHLKLCLDLDHHFEMQFIHDVFEYGKYYMLVLHFYKDKPMLKYDDELEEFENDFNISITQETISFNQNELTFGVQGNSSCSISMCERSDVEVSHVINYYSSKAHDEHFIFAIHRYSEMEPRDLEMQIRKVFKSNVSRG